MIKQAANLKALVAILPLLILLTFQSFNAQTFDEITVDWRNNNSTSGFDYQQARLQVINELTDPTKNYHPFVSKFFGRYDWFWSGRSTTNDVSKSGTFNHYNSMMKTYFDQGVCRENFLNNKRWNLIGPFNTPGEQFMGRVEAVYADPSDTQTIIMGTNASGIWKTIDGGVNWVNKTDGSLQIPYLGINDIVNIPNPSGGSSLFAITGVTMLNFNNAIGLIRSDDNGETWYPVDGFPTNSSTAGVTGEIGRNIDFDPSNPNTIFVSTTFKVYRSDDYGLTWVDKSPSLSPSSVPHGSTIEHREIKVGLNVAGDMHIYVSTVRNSAGTVLPLYHSSNGGDTWDDLAHTIPGAEYGPDELNGYGVMYPDATFLERWDNTPTISFLPFNTNPTHMWMAGTYNLSDAAVCIPEIGGDESMFSYFISPPSPIVPAGGELSFDAFIPAHCKLKVYSRRTTPGTTPAALLWESHTGFASMDEPIHEDIDIYSLLGPGEGFYNLIFAVVADTPYDGVTQAAVDNVIVRPTQDPTQKDFSLILVDIKNHDLDEGLYVAARNDHPGIILSPLAKSVDGGGSWNVMFPFYSQDIGYYKGEFSMGSDGVNQVAYLGGVRPHWYRDGTVIGSSVLHDDIRCIRVIEEDPLGTGLDKVLVGTDGGVGWNDGTSFGSFQDINGNNLPITQFYSFDISDNLLERFMGGAQDNGVYYRLTKDADILRNDAGDGGEIHVAHTPPNETFIYSWFGTGSGTRISSLTAAGTGIGASQNFPFSRNTAIMEQDPNDELTYYYSGINELYFTNDGWDSQGSIDITGAGDLRASAIAIAPSNSDIILVGTSRPFGTNTSNFGGHIWLTTDRGVTWTDLSFDNAGGDNASIYDMCQWFYPTDFVFDPNDPNRIWATMSGNSQTSPGSTDGERRVYFSEDMGVTWRDVSQGLTNVQHNQIIYHPGSNDRLFVASDLGVFYTDNGGDANPQWNCLNDGLPVCIVTDIEYHKCTRQLAVSTFGRGIFTLDISDIEMERTVLDGGPTYIFSGETEFASHLVIPDGVDVLVTGTIYMAKDAKIYVEKGAKLQVDGGTISNRCGEFWGGIVVEGTNSTSQNSFANRGTLILNNATLSYAHTAVKLNGEEPNGNNDWSLTGGVVGATNSVFYNNWKSFEFSAYTTTSNNLSSIEGCNFLTDDQYPDKDNGPYVHISMFDVIGVDIVNNNFINSHPDEFDFDKKGIGVVSLDAGYRLGPPVCLLDPYCTSTAGNKFFNLFAGVMTLEGSSDKKVTIDQNEFNGCNYGVKAVGGTIKDDITRNKFLIPKSEGGYPGGPFHWFDFGIFTDASDGFNVAENEFSTLGGGTLFNIGSYHRNGTILAKTNYKNDYINLSAGIQTVENNSNLVYDCNLINIGPTTAVGHHHATGTIADQGNCLDPTTLENRTANQWTGTCDPLVNQYTLYRNTLATDFPYGSYDGLNFEPTCAINLPQADVCIDGQTVPVGWCDSKLVGTITKPVILGTYFGLKSQQKQLEDQIDNGNSQALLELIKTGSSGQVKNELLEYSPFLSDEVLITYLRSSAPQGHIKQVLIANSPLTEKVIYWLNESKLAAGIVSQIEQEQTGVRALDAVEISRDYLEIRKNIELARLTRRFLDSVQTDSAALDSAIFYLEQDGSVQASCALVPLITKKDPVKAQVHLTTIREEAIRIESFETPFEDKSEQMKTFCDFHEFLIGIKSRPGSYFKLTEPELAFLRTIAERGGIEIRANAKAILDFRASRFQFEDGELFDFDKSTTPMVEEPLNEIMDELSIQAVPNPTNGSTTIEFSEPMNHAQLVIISVNGQLIHHQYVNGSIASVDLSGELAGIYFCRVIDPNGKSTQIKLIKTE